MSDNYVELHAKSFYSFGEGASHASELATRAAEYGQTALALTDTNLCGALEFANLAGTLGLKPITGGELTLSDGLPNNAAGEVQDPGTPISHSYFTSRQFDSDRREPRLDVEHLPDHAQGLIMLTGGRDGRLSRLLVEGRYAEARSCLGQLTEWYGSDSVYVELQRNSLDGDTPCAIGGSSDWPGKQGRDWWRPMPLSTTRRRDTRLQHALVAIRHNSTIDQQPPSHPAQ